MVRYCCIMFCILVVVAGGYADWGAGIFCYREFLFGRFLEQMAVLCMVVSGVDGNFAHYFKPSGSCRFCWWGNCHISHFVPELFVVRMVWRMGRQCNWIFQRSVFIFVRNFFICFYSAVDVLHCVQIDCPEVITDTAVLKRSGRYLSEFLKLPDLFSAERTEFVRLGQVGWMEFF